MEERLRTIRYASRIGLFGNIVLATAKILVGFVSGSFAVISDGLDSASDVLTFSVSLFATRVMKRPPDYKFPYGYQRAEAVATKVLSFIIFFVGAQLFYSSLERIITGDPHSFPSPIAIYVTIFSIFSKAALAWYQLQKGKKVESPILKANGKNMRNDILISLSVLLGLFFTYQLHLPILDLITALGISLWIMKEAFMIFMESNLELMDGVEDTSLYYKIFDAVEEVEGAYNPHRVRLRKHATQYVIALDIEVQPDIKISEAHQIAKKVEKNIRENVCNTYDVMVHTEPLGNQEREQFGLSREKMDNGEFKHKP
ncbi:MAG: cation diffusion facilitator family transporter [Bacteroidales bacterium]